MKKIILFSLNILLLITVCSFADDGIIFKSQRDFLASKGLTFDPYVIEDYVGVYKGGLIDNNTWLGRFDLVSDYDL